MARRKFLRGDWMNFSKLGRRRKKKLKYRKAKGRHNKIREKMKGHPRKVNIGFKKGKSENKAKIISNVKELLKIKKGEKAVIARIGNKKRIEIAREAEKNGIKIINLNIKKFLEKVEEAMKKENKAEEKKK